MEVTGTPLAPTSRPHHCNIDAIDQLFFKCTYSGLALHFEQLAQHIYRAHFVLLVVFFRLCLLIGD